MSQTIQPSPHDQILQRIPRPDHLIKIETKPLWRNRCRVNCWTRVNADTGDVVPDGRITQSWFVTLNDDGLVVHTDPPLPAARAAASTATRRQPAPTPA